MDIPQENVLAEPQRETSGPTTFSKYEYQYHWALSRIVEEHENKNSYAVFIELHEDVIISDSLISELANFEFNQVKNINKPKFNPNNLIKINSGEKSSVLGKLLYSTTNKSFSDRIKSINLVASCGFDFNYAKGKLKLDHIRKIDIDSKQITAMSQAIHDEIGLTELPATLTFIVPKLPLLTQQQYVISRIAELINNLFPNSHCNAINIYRTLIDELHRKGSDSLDYTLWSKLLDEKALTHEQVNKTILAHTKTSNEQLHNECDMISKELNLNYLKAKQLKREIDLIDIEIRSQPTALTLELHNNIARLVDNAITKYKNLDEIIEQISSNIKENLVENISPQKLYNTIIYEIAIYGK